MKKNFLKIFNQYIDRQLDKVSPNLKRFKWPFVAFGVIKKLALVFVLVAQCFSAQTLSSNLSKEKIALGEKATFRVTINGLEGKDVISKPKNELLPFHLEETKDEINKTYDQYTRTVEFQVFEEGKFYPMMKLKKGIPKVYAQEELRYGELLLKQKHPVLRLFLEKEIETKERVLSELCMRQGSHVVKRTQELREEVSYARNALLRYYQNN